MPPSPSSGTDEIPLLSLRDAEKRYGGKPVLRLSAVELRRKDRMLIVGGNGSGKSTLLRILAGVTPLSSGRADASPARHGLRACYVPQAGGLYQSLTVTENIAALSRLVGAQAPANLAERWYIRELGLVDYLHAKGGELSGGFQKLAAIACALAAEPQGLFLDEPLTGVDPDHADSLLGALRTQSTELEFMVVTDHSADRFPFANRVVELARGASRS